MSESENSPREKFKSLVEAGDKFAEKGEWDEAIRTYESALKEFSSAKEVYERLARMYVNKRDKKRYMETVQRYQEAAAQKPPVSQVPPPQTVPAPSAKERVNEPAPPHKPVTEADMAEAEAKNWEREGKPEPASKLYFQAAKLWEESGERDKAASAYEKGYELNPSMEILSKLNQFYGLGAKIKQSTVIEIYRKIYHMKV